MTFRCLLAAALFSATAFAATPTLPDVSTGSVGGLTGLLYWPADLPKANGEPQPLPSAAGCEVHMVPISDFDRELRYPCGNWFVLPTTDRYHFWLETATRITPSVSMIVYTPTPFAGRGAAAIVPVMPSGRIAIPAGRTIPATDSLRFLSIEARHSWSTRIFERRLHESTTAVQMPEGRVVVGRFDRKSNDAIALSQPVEIKAGTTTHAWPSAPVESDLLIVFSKPPELQRSKPIAAQLLLTDGATRNPPDVLLNGFDRIIAIWYSITARTATLSFQSADAFWQPQEVRFTRGKVTTIRSRLTLLPKVSVSINAPMEKTLGLEVSRVAEREPLRKLSVQAGIHEIGELPAEPLRVTLTIERWKFVEYVDLTKGDDASAVFDLKPIEVHGRVFHGEDAAPAEIAFRNGEEWVRVETSDRGEYETTFWSPDVYTARIAIKGTNQPPFLDAFRKILHSGTVDFHVPRTDYSVRVRDAMTKRPIANARVMAGLLWTDESSNARQEAQPVFTDESGRAILPPLRKGELLVDVRAEHYAAREALRMTVDDQHHEIDVDLRPLTITATLRLLLPDGASAVHADAWAFNDAMRPLWRGTANDDGDIDVPDIAVNALLLVRHPNAASTIRRVTASESWTLNSPAEPLTLVAEKTRIAIVAVWLDGVKLSGPPLAFATWSTLATNPSGIWVGHNLPPKSLDIAISDAGPHRVAYPWPPRVDTPNF